MLLENKNAVIYGAAGAVGGAVARAFAREGARVFLTGRNLDAINTLAKEISAAGRAAETAQVDALDGRPWQATSMPSSTRPARSISRSTPSGFRSTAYRAFLSPASRRRIRGQPSRRLVRQPGERRQSGDGCGAPGRGAGHRIRSRRDRVGRRVRLVRRGRTAPQGRQGSGGGRDHRRDGCRHQRCIRRRVVGFRLCDAQPGWRLTTVVVQTGWPDQTRPTGRGGHESPS